MAAVQKKKKGESLSELTRKLCGMKSFKPHRFLPANIHHNSGKKNPRTGPEFKRKRLDARIYRVDEDELSTLKRRTDIAAMIVITLLALIIARLWYLQIHRGSNYEQLSETNRVRVLNIPASRGNILDRKGQVMVTSRPSFNIVWNKDDTPDPDSMLKNLARITGEDITVLLDRIRKASDLPRHIPITLMEDIPWQTLAVTENNHLELPGIRIMALPIREYLHQDRSAHVIGYLGKINKEELKDKQDDNYDQTDEIGKMGIEKIFESTLRGEKGKQFMEVDAQGFEQRRLKGIGALPGSDIQLTLDLDLQTEAEKAMGDKAGAVVVMEVNTGRILALASTPTMSLEQFIGGISQENWKALLEDPLRPLINKPIMGQYPPGSTFKMISALAGLTEGIVTPDTAFYCSGSLQFGNRRYGCWKKSGHGTVQLNRALAESCDVYFYQIAQRINVDVLAKYSESFGMGRITGIELEHEKSGLIPTAEWKKRVKKQAWQKGENLSIIIGQGFTLTTPLQVTLMTAALANGGTLYRPQLIEKIQGGPAGAERVFTPIAEGRVHGNSQTIKLIRKGMEDAVNKPHGTGQAARFNEITVAGKTGTAQVVRLAKFKDVDEKNIPFKYRDHAWFTCYAPAENPEIAVTVLVEHGGHGGSAAAPIARKILAWYFNITPPPAPATVVTD